MLPVLLITNLVLFINKLSALITMPSDIISASMTVFLPSKNQYLSVLIGLLILKFIPTFEVIFRFLVD